MASEDASRAKLRRAFDAHYEAVSRYCLRRLPPADANDAAAQVFTVAWRKVDAMPADEEAQLPWLYAVARYEVGSMRRTVRRRRNLQEKLRGQARHPHPGPETIVVRNSDETIMVEALSRLRPNDQEILRLRAYEELSLAEVAEVLGCSLDAAKKRSARAMQRLRRASGFDADPQPRPGSTTVPEGGE